jgi:hypothetical protein
MKTTAYLRIPTIDQDIEKNKADILKSQVCKFEGAGYPMFVGVGV